MIEPVALADFFTVFFSAASVILFGAAYALIFAWSRVRSRPGLMPVAYGAYVGLAVSVYVLADVAHLFNHAFWIFVVLLMLAGYLWAPHAIWHLCVRTHDAEHADGDVPVKVYQQQ